MKTINVDTTDKYDILLGNGVFDDIPSIIMPFCPTKKVLIVTDDIVDNLYGNILFDNLTKNEYRVAKFVFKNGEQSKTIDTLSEILEFALKNNFHRNDLFLALGGGVVGDITGLASALYMRGVNLIQIPTTLLSSVDSSIGGKTAIDLKGGKNCAGVFKQPKSVIIDTDIIKNLPTDIFAEGMGEVIKCGVIKQLPIFNFIGNGTVAQNLDKVIFDCLMLKKEIVEKDEFDTKGIRNLLNAGHTIGHSIELNSKYTIPHGKAVATGLYIEAVIAERLGLCDELTVKTIKNAVEKFDLLFDIPYSASDIAKGCLADKKNRDGKVLFLLPANIGNLKEILLSPEEIQNLLSI